MKNINKGRKLVGIAIPFFAFALTGCLTIYPVKDTGQSIISDITEQQKAFFEKYSLKKYTSMFLDTGFNNGFTIPVARDSITHSRSNPKEFKYLQYDAPTGISSTKTTQTTSLSQWWRPECYDILQNSTYTTNGTVHTWKNDARSIQVDTANGALTLQCDAGKEFAARTDEPNYVDSVKKELICATRNADGSIIEITDNGSIDRWPHFLLESSVPADMQSYYKLSDYQKCYVEFDFRLNKCNYTGGRTAQEIAADNPLSYRYAAQIFFYVCIYNIPQSSSVKEANRGIWVGIPLYDSRYKNYAAEISIDAGFTGATNRVIYKCAQSEANPAVSDSQGVVAGQTYHIKYDMMPLMKEAYQYAYSIDPNGIYGAASFEGMAWDNIKLNYFNIGYELPGAYDISATISEFDVYYEK